MTLIGNKIQFGDSYLLKETLQFLVAKLRACLELFKNNYQH